MSELRELRVYLLVVGIAGCLMRLGVILFEWWWRAYS